MSSELANSVLTREFDAVSFTLVDQEVETLGKEVYRLMDEARALEDAVIIKGPLANNSLNACVDSLRTLRSARTLKEEALKIHNRKLQKIKELIAEEESWLSRCEAALKGK
jgi:hypothetical protein